MGGIKSYEQKKIVKSATQRLIDAAGEFPKCKGLYPDCPESPTLSDKNCRTCPKTDGIKKPKPVVEEEAEEIVQQVVEEKAKEDTSQNQGSEAPTQ